MDFLTNYSTLNFLQFYMHHSNFRKKVISNFVPSEKKNPLVYKGLSLDGP